MKICPVCGNPFEPPRTTQKYCSADCRIADANLRARLAMREKRGSFAPKPCADCGKPLVGRAKRCPDCRTAAERRKQREFHARPDVRARDNEARRVRMSNDPDKHRLAQMARDKAKWERLKADPARHEEYKEARRAYAREYAAEIRREKEMAGLRKLAGETE